MGYTVMIQIAMHNGIRYNPGRMLQLLGLG
jgi:hypothetical protein